MLKQMTLRKSKRLKNPKLQKPLKLNPKLKQMSRIYNVPRARTAVKLYIPQSMPSILSGVQSTLGLMVKLIIAAEVMSNTARSIGQSMSLAQMYLETDVLIAYTLVAIVLSAALEGIVALIKKYALRWNCADNI